jgi:hypothetical protein
MNKKSMPERMQKKGEIQLWNIKEGFMNTMDRFCRVIAFLLLVSFVSCASAPYTINGVTITSGAQQPRLRLLQAGGTQRTSSQKTAQQAGQAQAAASTYWTGDGGMGKSITILPPKGVGLAKEQAYLPDFVANELVSNFDTFSAMTLFNRVANQEQYNELLSGIYADNDKAGLDLGHLASTDYMLLGNITKTSTGYALQLTVNRNSDKTTAASYSGTVSIVDLDNLTGVRRASLDLLAKMGVALTAQAKRELAWAPAENRVQAQEWMAQGIAAQRQGNEVTAMMYATIAALYDPSLLEAGSRSSILTANISSGSMGENIRNDIRWRDEWAARLKETEQVFNSFFDNFFKTLPSMPYTLFYYSDIKQVGETNYQNRTANLSGIRTNLRASQGWALAAEPPLQAAQKSIQAVLDGLNATKRKDVWGLGSWPQQGAFNRSFFGRQARNFTVVVELVNSQNKVIGRETFQTGGSCEFPMPLPGGGTRNQVAADEQKTVNFNNVKADDITDNMTIRIASVNGTAAETAARDGVLQIRAITKNEFDNSSRLKFSGGEIQGFANNATKSAYLIIPAAVWGERVTAVGEKAFADAGLSNVTIPEGVISIGASAFARNGLGSVTIPEGVTTIGENTFAGNYYWKYEGSNEKSHYGLARVTIPSSITFIGHNAFTSVWTTDEKNSDGSIRKTISHELPTEITIGEGLSLEKYNTFPRGFVEFYDKQGRKAGIYRARADYESLLYSGSDRWERFNEGKTMEQTVVSRDKSKKVLGIIGGVFLVGGLLGLGIWATKESMNM